MEHIRPTPLRHPATPRAMLPFLLSLLVSPVAHSMESQDLTWEIRAGGAVIGSRTATIKYQPTNGDIHRIIESWTDIRGRVGPVDEDFQQRLT